MRNLLLRKEKKIEIEVTERRLSGGIWRSRGGGGSKYEELYATLINSILGCLEVTSRPH